MIRWEYQNGDGGFQGWEMPSKIQTRLLQNPSALGFVETICGRMTMMVHDATASWVESNPLLPGGLASEIEERSKHPTLVFSF